jgi:NitT/TauT family transport system ATP-binding protein
VTGAPSPKAIFHGVTRRFGSGANGITAVGPVDLTIRDGEFLCILGPSGCGKTTLLRILGDLERQSEGRVEFFPSGGVRPTNAMVFQEHGIMPWLTARENIAFGLKARGVPRRERLAIADRFIGKVNLTQFGDAYPHQLSGGMKQRVSIARAFATDPDILLMDEPFAALDEQTKILLQAELLRIWEESYKTVVYVTHSLDEAIVLADRVLVMTNRPGRIKTIIDIAGLFGRPRDVEAVKRSPEYGQVFTQIWDALRDEVIAHEREYRA